MTQLQRVFCRRVELHICLIQSRLYSLVSDALCGHHPCYWQQLAANLFSGCYRYKGLTGGSHSVEERIRTHAQNSLATSHWQPSLLSGSHMYSLTAQPTRPVATPCIHALSKRQRSHCKASSITQTLLTRDDQPTPVPACPLRLYIAPLPLCTVADSSGAARRTNVPSGMRRLSAAMSPRQFTNRTASMPMHGHMCLHVTMGPTPIHCAASGCGACGGQKVFISDMADGFNGSGLGCCCMHDAHASHKRRMYMKRCSSLHGFAADGAVGLRDGKTEACTSGGPQRVPMMRRHVTVLSASCHSAQCNWVAAGSSTCAVAMLFVW